MVNRLLAYNCPLSFLCNCLSVVDTTTSFHRVWYFDWLDWNNLFCLYCFTLLLFRFRVATFPSIRYLNSSADLSYPLLLSQYRLFNLVFWLSVAIIPVSHLSVRLKSLRSAFTFDYIIFSLNGSSFFLFFISFIPYNWKKAIALYLTRLLSSVMLLVCTESIF